MKGIDIFCTSQAATAIYFSMEEAYSSSSTILVGGGSCSPAIDRCNPIITDSRRTAKPLPPHRNRHKKKHPKPPSKENADQINNGAVRKSWSCTKPGDFISPPGSTRYLLSEKVLFNTLSDFDESFHAKPPSPSASHDQVVVLRVSLHCRGCEKKMRKHISRMEGVRSFNIDFTAKKVTVTGKITPLEVLSSISKVKKAQLWPPTISSSSSSSTPTPIDLINAELKNQEINGSGAWVMDKRANFVGIAS